MDKIPFSVYDFFGYLATGALLLLAVDFAFGGVGLLGEPLGVVMGLFWILVAYVLGHIVSHIASSLMEDVILREGLGSPEYHLFGVKKAGGWARLFPGNFRPFSQTIQDRVLAKAKRLNVPAPGDGFFAHCHTLAKGDQVTQERLNTFLNLYGFCRNMSMGLLLAVPLLLYGAFRGVDWETFGVIRRDRLLWAGLALAASIGMFYRYLKFFRHYAMEVFRTYSELPDPQQGQGRAQVP